MRNGDKMSLVRRVALLASLMSLFLVPAQAETLVPGTSEGADTLFLSFLTSDAFASVIAQRTKAYESGLGYTCDEDRYTIGFRRAQIIRPVVTVAEGPLFISENIAQPTGGMWSNKHVVTRCGSSVIYNSIASVAPNGQLNVQHLVLGNTGLHSLLIIRFKPVVARMAAIPECKAVSVADTRQGVAEGVTVSQPDAIYETWTINGCDQSVRLVIRFDRGENNSGLVPVVENRTVLN